MPDKAAVRRPDGVKVTFRRMKFDFEDGFDRYWHGGSPFRSLFWTQLSTAFEPGEKFFIDSARALRSEVDDPELLDEVAEFCKQEGHHTAQHLKFDRMNAEMGVDVDGCRARYTRLLDRARDKLDPTEMLAATVALEHFTAGFAELYFKRESLSEGADRRVHALWSWHAAEEAEHKATCFDVYRAVGGSEWKRIVVMPASWFLILWLSMVNTFVLLWKDRKLFDLRDVFGGLWYLFGPKGLVTGLAPSFFAYLSPRFHPWKADNSDDIVRWQAENARYITGLDPPAAPAATTSAPPPAPA